MVKLKKCWFGGYSTQDDVFLVSKDSFNTWTVTYPDKEGLEQQQFFNTLKEARTFIAGYLK